MFVSTTIPSDAFPAQAANDQSEAFQVTITSVRPEELKLECQKFGDEPLAAFTRALWGLDCKVKKEIESLSKVRV